MQVQKVINKIEALNLLKRYCSREERCEYDIIQKMKLYLLAEEDREEILSYLKEQKYVSNSRYANAFVNDKFRFNKWGKTKIAYALSQKCISSATVQQAINSIDDEEYSNLLESEIKKKAVFAKADSEFEMKSKLYRFALSRGFENEIIRKVLDKLSTTILIVNIFSLFN